jgi:hypothetical protein
MFNKDLSPKSLIKFEISIYLFSLAYIVALQIILFLNNGHEIRLNLPSELENFIYVGIPFFGFDMVLASTFVRIFAGNPENQNKFLGIKFIFLRCLLILIPFILAVFVVLLTKTLTLQYIGISLIYYLIVVVFLFAELAIYDYKKLP